MSTTPDPKSPGNRTIIEGMRLVADFEQSGLIQAAYARQVGLSDKVMSYWVRRVRSLRLSAQATSPAAASPPPTALVHVADMRSDGVITPVRAPPPAAPAVAIPAAPRLQRMAHGIGIEVRCGNRSLLVGPGFDRALLRELIQVLEELPPC